MAQEVDELLFTDHLRREGRLCMKTKLRILLFTLIMLAMNLAPWVGVYADGARGGG